MKGQALVGASLACALVCLPVWAGEKSIADLVEETSSSVVYIEGDVGCGSGFVFRTDPEVEILTNHHVMKGSKRYTISFFLHDAGGAPCKEEVEGYRYFAYPRLDFGLIRLTPTDPSLHHIRPRIKALPRGDSQALRVGERVFLIGSPGAGMLSLGNSVSEGIVSGKNRHVKGIPYLQTTAAVNFGNSGGPLLNMKGQVVGLVTAKQALAESIGFALPIHMTDGKHYRFYLPEPLSKQAAAHVAAGNHLLAEKRYEEARLKFQMARRLDPTKARPVILEGHTYVCQGQTAHGAAFYEQALAMKGIHYDDLMTCVLELGKIHGRAHDHDRAIRAFTAGLERDPFHEALNRNIGVTYANMGKTSKALAHWYLSLAANPDQPQLRRDFRKLLAR